MNPAASVTHLSIRLPATLAIGFTGHRKLDDEARCRKLIHDYLSECKSATPGTVYGVSSVAAGGDVLFAESCIELGIPLRVLLPLPQEQFRDDFDAATWERVQQILGKAVSVEITGANESREERYYECGIETVHQSRLLIALWDGKPSNGLGGTESIVAFATGLSRPVAWIHSVTGELLVLNSEREAELLSDPELDFLNGLPDPTGELASQINEPRGLARAWFLKVDNIATQSAPRVRHFAILPITFTALGALFSGAASSARVPVTWLLVGAILGLTAALVPAAFRLDQGQALWGRTRTAAEVCRSTLAAWDTPSLYDAIAQEVIPELAGMLRSLNLLKMLDRSRREVSLDEFKRRYLEERVLNQMSYFASHAERSAAEARAYRLVVKIFIVLGILLNAWLLASAFGTPYLSPGHWKRWVSLASSIAFEAATVLGAMLVVNDCDRRQKRYLEMHRMLSVWSTALEKLRTWSGAQRIVNRIESALLVEVIEWRSLIRHRRLHRK
jgi:hypothetical protein